MTNPHTEGIIVHCIDFRFQKFINKWISEHIRPKIFDRVALAGATKNLATILDQIDIAYRLHNIKKAVIINHEDCGAYGAQGHKDHHVRDLQNVKKEIKNKFPNLEVETYYLRLDGTFEPIA